MININGNLYKNIDSNNINDFNFIINNFNFYEEIHFENELLFFWEDHFFRIMASLRRLRYKIPVSFNKEYLKNELIKTIKANKLEKKYGNIKFYFFSKPNENKIDYLNTHGTSTPVGDITELNAVGETFGKDIPKISSTKSLSGHPLGAASVHEAIYSLIMMKNNFITASANINDIDEDAKKFPIVRQTEKNVELKSVMSNSFGFGGTNATLIFEKAK